MNRWSLALLMAGSLLLTGCPLIAPSGNDNDNSSNTNTNDNAAGGTESNIAAMRQFSSDDELRQYFIDQLSMSGGVVSMDEVEDQLGGGFISDSDDAAVNGGALPPASPGGAEDGDGTAAPTDSDREPFSGTTTQELGVQEADVVKNDGEYFYVLTGEKLKIIRANPLELVSTVELEGYGQDVYLTDNRLVAITQPYDEPVIIQGGPVPTDGGSSGGSSGGGVAEPGVIEPDTGVSSDIVVDPAVEGEVDPVAPPVGATIDIVGIEPFYYYRPRTQITVVDIADRAAPAVLSQTTFHGSSASGRMIGDRLHLVIANHPMHYYGMIPMMGMAGAEFDDVDLEVFMPKYEIELADGTTLAGDAVTRQRFFAPVDSDGFGVTSIISMDINDPAAFSSIGIVAEPSTIYASTEALYLTDGAYTWWGQMRETTDVYKFDFTEAGIELAAAGSVPGRIADQYRMSEYDGLLRVATTTQALWDERGQVRESGNNLYVLEQVDSSLNVVGRLEDLAPGEDIRSARFMGDRAVLVTFRQIDPFFTIDLSDPTSPEVLAELKVPGFSTFMVPMDENHMLTVGQYVPLEGPAVPDGIQISIFDITDFSNPVRSHNVIIPGQSVYSEAVWNPKAFTYFPEENLLALPVEIYNYYDWLVDWDFARTEDGQTIAADDVNNVDLVGQGGQGENFSGIYVYRVTAEDGLERLGRVSTARETLPYIYYSAFTRGAFIGDDVYAVTNHTIVTVPVAELETAEPESLDISEVDLSGWVDGGVVYPVDDSAVGPESSPGMPVNMGRPVEDMGMMDF